MKIYVITKGEYSDYHICAVATDLERAETLKRYYSECWEDAEIEEYDTDNPVIDTEPRPVFSINISRDGKVQQKGNQAWTYDSNFENRFHLHEYMTHSYLDFDCTVVAEDWEHAVKIAADRRNQMIAEFLGL